MEVTKKIESEDLKRLQDLNTEISNIIVSLGQIELNKAALENQKNQLLANFAQLQQTQEELANDLTQKYGDGNIDLASGEITSLR